tara:strand:- start:466 stop:633 length:168 start_codon:yes stop_codon:yes gene_type:complete
MENLIKKYNKDIIDFVIKVDKLTEKEIKDIDYLEDRIQTHLENNNWNAIELKINK